MSNATEIVVSPLNNKRVELIENAQVKSTTDSEILELSSECANEITTLPTNVEENTVVPEVELNVAKPHSASEISVQNACITEITVSPVHNEDDSSKVSDIHEEEDPSDVLSLEEDASEIIVHPTEDDSSPVEVESSTKEIDEQMLDVYTSDPIVEKEKDGTESLSTIQPSITDKDEPTSISTAVVPFNPEKNYFAAFCTLDGDEHPSSLPGSANGTRWETVLPQCVFCKDFIPKKCPDKSNCWNTIYNSFGEVVEQANSWLSVQTNMRVVACEAAPMNASGSSAQRDAWPYHTALRGIRIWVQKSTDERPRVVLGYRDFIPRQKKKGMFSGTAQTVEELCDGISSYLTNRLPSVSLVSVQTLDGPMSGMYDGEVETESGSVSYAPNGFTRFCRFLRVFFLTEYQTSKTKKKAPTAVVVGIRDFSARTNEDTVTQVIERALAWCDAEPAVHLCNIEVLNQKAGHDSSSYSWLLESPGMVHSKFYRFVRLVYMVDDIVDEQESLERTWEDTNAITQEPWKDRSITPEFDGRIWNTELKGFSCTSFLPQMIEPHCSVWGGIWETNEELTGRVSAWLMESKRQVATISTHHVRTVGNSVSLDDTAWVRHAPFAVWLPVIHVITSLRPC